VCPVGARRSFALGHHCRCLHGGAGLALRVESVGVGVGVGVAFGSGHPVTRSLNGEAIRLDKTGVPDWGTPVICVGWKLKCAQRTHSFS
jgi:hypothetical protein